MPLVDLFCLDAIVDDPIEMKQAINQESDQTWTILIFRKFLLYTIKMFLPISIVLLAISYVVSGEQLQINEPSEASQWIVGQPGIIKWSKVYNFCY